MPTPELHTERLLLRAWTRSDRSAFAAMNADPAVMEHFPALLTRAESEALADRIESGFAEHGFGLWAVDAGGEFLGFTGLSVPSFHVDWMDGHPQPIVEVGWRLKCSAWGHGYATEAARRSLAFGFDDLGLPEIFSFTALSNQRSQAVMRRIGMLRLADYDHPAPDAGPIQSVPIPSVPIPSVVYRSSR